MPDPARHQLDDQPDTGSPKYALVMRRWLSMVAALALAGSMSASAGAQQAAETFRIVVLPDTQIYAQSNSGAEYFTGQTNWVVADAASSRTVFVSHVGDVVQNPDNPQEWDRVEPALTTLDLAQIPYAISPGNHDLVDGGAATIYDQRFGANRFSDKPWFGGRHLAEGNRSSFQTVSIDGHDLLFLHLRHLRPTYGDVDDVLVWADSVLASHPNHLTFVTTHEFTATDGTVVYGQLEELLSSRCTIAAVFSGHLPLTGTGVFTDTCGRQVRHILTNFQTLTQGGQGFLRLVDIDPYTLDTSFSVYSPTLDQYRTGPAEQFTDTLSQLEPVLGDVSCDRIVDAVDALFIVQHAALSRSDARTRCPLSSASTQLNLASADFDGNAAVDILDALRIAQCATGVANAFCPG